MVLAHLPCQMASCASASSHEQVAAVEFAGFASLPPRAHRLVPFGRAPRDPAPHASLDRPLGSPRRHPRGRGCVAARRGLEHHRHCVLHNHCDHDRWLRRRRAPNGDRQALDVHVGGDVFACHRYIPKESCASHRGVGGFEGQAGPPGEARRLSDSQSRVRRGGWPFREDTGPRTASPSAVHDRCHGIVPLVGVGSVAAEESSRGEGPGRCLLCHGHGQHARLGGHSAVDRWREVARHCVDADRCAIAR
mmetsp:Transcript_117830/g.293871  ORF Transcript_117830/g.293871 Transcript_117830/m.293871 type:complete len:249 (+) Transcript_117830:277-1023(+)